MKGIIDFTEVKKIYEQVKQNNIGLNRNMKI